MISIVEYWIIPSKEISIYSQYRYIQRNKAKNSKPTTILNLTIIKDRFDPIDWDVKMQHYYKNLDQIINYE